MLASGREKIVFDTDPGVFSDDVHAAVMLLRSPEAVKILGMTTVSGNTWAQDGYKYMQHVLNLLGRSEVPVRIGAQLPLVHNAAMSRVEEKNWGPLQFTGAFAHHLAPL